MSDHRRKEKFRTASENEAVSFKTFGEATDLPVQIRKAGIGVVDRCPLLRHFLASLEMTVVNDVVQEDDVSGKLRIVLPSEATVKKFEVTRCAPSCDPVWYPAVPVAKTKAKEVVYKEKEKGREVACVSDVASGSNIFEIEVSPLPYQKEVRCRLEFLVTGKVQEFQNFLEHCFPDEATEVFTIPDGNDNKNSNVEKVHTTSQKDDTDDAGIAVVGESFGKTHFVCRVPSQINSKIDLQSSSRAKNVNVLDRVAIVWDVSASMLKSEKLISARCERLGELFAKRKELSSSNASLVLELYTFGIGPAVKVGYFDSVEGLLNAIKTVDYDGGTDVTTLSALFSNLSQRDKAEQIDAALIFTDGMDNLGKVPPVNDGLFSVPFPVHVIADMKEKNLRGLRALASISPQHRGWIFSSKDETYVNGILFPQPILKSIETDQSEDAFIQEVNDGFECTPDHRLQQLNEPLTAEGILISGILGDQVSTIVATVDFDGEIFEYRFDLRENASKRETQQQKGQVKPQNVHNCSTVFMYNDVSYSKQIETYKSMDPTKLISYIYAEEKYKEIGMFGMKSGLDLKSIQEKLAIRYGFVSPESSLLMLYDIDQFIENGILPPNDHPVYMDQKAEEQRKKHAQDNAASPMMNSFTNIINVKHKIVKSSGEGNVGEPKNEKQRKNVKRLATKLNDYFEKPCQKPYDNSESPQQYQVRGSSMRMSRRAGGLRSLRLRPNDESAPADMLFGGGGGSRRLRLRPNDESAPRRGRGSSGAAAVRHMSLQPSLDAAAPASILSGAAPAAPWASFGTSAAPGFVNEEFGAAAPAAMLFGAARATPTPSSFSDIHKDESAIAPPKEPEVYSSQLENALKNINDMCSWKQVYYNQRAEMNRSSVSCISPSFFLTCARLVLKHGKALDAIRIVMNCLEMEVEDVQMLRCVGYFLLSTRDCDGITLALEVLKKVQELQPCEPQSFLDSALARFFHATNMHSRLPLGTASGNDFEQLRSDIIHVQRLIVRVLTHQWANRFDEIEWPALILLHYVADFAKEVNIMSDACDIMEWPTSDLISSFQDSLRCSKFNLALMVWLGWDTDKTDIDLHVIEPTKNEVYYSNRLSSVGGNLSRDFTSGYGPEVYILKDGDTKEEDSYNKAGEYEIYAKYYASHQDSALTGATSALLWTIKKDSSNGKKQIQFHTLRLDTHKEKTRVGVVKLA